MELRQKARPLEVVSTRSCTPRQVRRRRLQGVRAGSHGVGASVVNALSEWLEVEGHRDGKIYQMKFSRGLKTEDMTVVGETDHTGTTVRFKPDPEMFEDLVYDYETLHVRMREQAFLNAGLPSRSANLRGAPGERGQAGERAQRRDGATRAASSEFVSYINRNKNPVHGEVSSTSPSYPGVGTAEAEVVALQYTDS